MGTGKSVPERIVIPVSINLSSSERKAGDYSDLYHLPGHHSVEGLTPEG